MTSVEMLKLATAMFETGANPNLIDPEWTTAVFGREMENGQTIFPGAQQFDNSGRGLKDYLGRNVNPSSTFLRANQYRIPDLRELPSGRYNAANAVNEAWRRQMQATGRPLPSAHGLNAMEGALSLAIKPSPALSGTNMLDMAQVLKSWGRQQARLDPAYGQAFKMFNRPANSKLLGMIGTGLKSLR